jgi:glutaconate CoA-transferase subunit A
MPIDWLIAGGCVSKIITGLVSFEGFGLAPNFRKATENRTVQIEEYSEHLLICRLQAQAQNLPFIPTRAGIGSDVLKLHSSTKTVREEVDTLTGEHYVACSRLPLDIAIVHAHEADLLGNVRVLPKLIWMDNEIQQSRQWNELSITRYSLQIPLRQLTHAL